MINPVIAFDGNTYEKENITKYLNDNGTLPISGEKVSNVKMAISDLTTNRLLKQEINTQENICEEQDFDVDGIDLHCITELITTKKNETEKMSEKNKEKENQEPPKKRQRTQ